MPGPLHIDIPETDSAVFANDGRVFYDLAAIVSMITGVADSRANHPMAIHEDRYKGQVEGIREIATALDANREFLIIAEGMGA